jgi:hypothetical protein
LNLRTLQAHRLWPLAAHALALGCLLICLSPGLAAADELAPTAATPAVATPAMAGRRADFAHEEASDEARQIADWAVDSTDSQGRPFIIVDKRMARVFVFDANGHLRGAASALLGLARGDDAVPGIGSRPLASIRPEERTTPAGRFVASLDRNLHGDEVLWVDYDLAVSLHRVVTANRKEHRLERLASATLADKRISYGCINVPASFFETVVIPAFSDTDGIVYVLPETRSARELFASYDVEEHARQRLGPPSPAAGGSGRPLAQRP